jgi:hypothetical protein
MDRSWDSISFGRSVKCQNPNDKSNPNDSMSKFPVMPRQVLDLGLWHLKLDAFYEKEVNWDESTN